MKPKYAFGQVLTALDGRTGKVVEVTLFRREESLAYGLRDKTGHVFYVSESQIKFKPTGLVSHD
jgi:hypothetical protein